MNAQAHNTAVKHFGAELVNRFNAQGVFFVNTKLVLDPNFGRVDTVFQLANADGTMNRWMFHRQVVAVNARN